MCGFSQSELINRMDETMLVNEYAQKVISERQYLKVNLPNIHHSSTATTYPAKKSTTPLNHLPLNHLPLNCLDKFYLTTS